VDSVCGAGAGRRRIPNYVRKGLEGSAAELLVDKAQSLTLTAPEMTVLIGGLRA